VKHVPTVKLLIKTLGLTTDFENNFNDVSKENYYYEAVGIARKLGITTGNGNVMRFFDFVSE